MKNINNLDEIKGNELYLKKIIRVAQYESELELGVNPSDFEQANTGYLTEHDFEYIHKICALVEEKLKDFIWLKNTINEIENKSGGRTTYSRGIRFDDELFKVGRGILESFLIEKYKEQK
ncbi:MAG: hypothetical protein A2275_07480 [Bacteroidetes bacterium RIFOXYA12_FULL_35_11]|nr:MAG: hypothetical protein A2X01_04280 [Bacteroidetes bacterium GWF2_35_48]OFY73130.1 MAG: hypothetical protein A2275_07480 [Bacteroidetes bacterium RIFOXYA12_FULL_35_11]HBX51568.1 hypothetical protein [Bacteroidales bacterium]